MMHHKVILDPKLPLSDKERTKQKNMYNITIMHLDLRTFWTLLRSPHRSFHCSHTFCCIRMLAPSLESTH